MEGQNDAARSAPPAAMVRNGSNNSNSSASFSSSGGGSGGPPPPSPQRISRRSISAPHASHAATTTAAAATAANKPNTNVATTTKNNNAGNNPSAARVVPRPPLNIYLKVAIIRDGNDVVVCEDPEYPGRTKQIVITNQQLLDSSEANDATNNAITKEGGSSGAAAAAVKKEQKIAQSKKRQEQQQQQQPTNNNNSTNNNSNNKKEIPVPTIATVRRYDTDVPPNYPIPTSYVRHTCPTYDEVLDGTIDYNIDVEDERWWRNHGEFGPFSRAKIMLGDQELVSSESSTMADSKKNSLDQNIDSAGSGPVEGLSSVPNNKEGGGNNKKSKTDNNKQGGRNKKGKFVKKNSSKKIIDDNSRGGNDNDEDNSNMDIDRTDSDISARSSSTHPHNNNKHYYTIEQVLSINPKYLHSPHSTHHLIQKYNPKLPLKLFEQMMDILEKATGFESIVTNSQAEEILTKKIPQLVDIFGPLSAKERRLEVEDEERHLERWLRKIGETTSGGDNDIVVPIQQKKHADVVVGSSSSSEQKPPPQPTTPLLLPTLAQPITLPAVIHQVYNYWVSKRSKLKKPLLRRYWPPTAVSDLNPHQVFRQPNKEKKRRLRKKKQNDLEAYKKMKQLKLDFERVGVLCDLIRRRESVNETLVELTNDYFEDRLFGFVDTSGVVPRRQRSSSERLLLDKFKIESVLNVPKYFDDGPIVRVKGGKKRKRSSSHMGWNVDSRDPSPVPPPGVHSGHHHPGGPRHPPNAMVANLPHGMKKPPPMSVMPIPPPRNIVVAGHDGGFPAPNFLQPLASRESHPITTWEDAVPTMPSYINGKATITPMNKFRHRPRLGRGGRIVIDRVPLPSSSTTTCTKNNGPAGGGGIIIPPPPTVITYGSGMQRSGYDISTLGADGPNYRINSSPDKYGPNRSPDKFQLAAAAEDGTGTNAASAPKAPPAQYLSDLLPKSLGNPVLLSRKIEEICALGLLEDCSQTTSRSTGATTSAATATAGVSVSSSKSGGNAAASSSSSVGLGDEMDEILIPIEDWMEATEGMKIYGSEKFVIGPL